MSGVVHTYVWVLFMCNMSGLCPEQHQTSVTHQHSDLLCLVCVQLHMNVREDTISLCPLSVQCTHELRVASTYEQFLSSCVWTDVWSCSDLLHMSSLCSCVTDVWSCSDNLIVSSLMSGLCPMCSCVTDVWSCSDLLCPLSGLFMSCVNWCLDLFSYTDICSCSDLLCPLWVHVLLMSGIAQTKSEQLQTCVHMSGEVQTYYVWSVFMCNWCLELLRCVMDVWSCLNLLCPLWVHV